VTTDSAYIQEELDNKMEHLYGALYEMRKIIISLDLLMVRFDTDLSRLRRQMYEEMCKSRHEQIKDTGDTRCP